MDGMKAFINELEDMGSLSSAFHHENKQEGPHQIPAASSVVLNVASRTVQNKILLLVNSQVSGILLQQDQHERTALFFQKIKTSERSRFGE